MLSILNFSISSETECVWFRVAVMKIASDIIWNSLLSDVSYSVVCFVHCCSLLASNRENTKAKASASLPFT